MVDSIPDNVTPVKVRPQTIHSRVSAGEYEAISAAAKAAGLTISAFFKAVMLEGAGVKPVFTDDDRAILSLILEDMRTIGINLNEVARAVNGGKADVEEDVSHAIAEVQKMQFTVLSELQRVARRAGYTRRDQG